MAYLHEFNPNDYEKLLAADRPAVPDPEVTGILPVNQNDRTLLIGLGGTGVKVVDQIKQQIQERCAPGHPNYVQFLAIDTDPVELENANFLTPGEKVCLTRPGMGAMQHGDPANWPPAWHQIVEPADIHNLPPFGIPGAGGNRLVGKLKLYAQSPGVPGNDVQICQKLDAAMHQFAPGPVGCYRVYVIGSLYGGTGSGCFLEMPPLIRSVLPPHLTVEIHAMLLTANARDPRVWHHHNMAFQANCYAALKELDYYQGLRARPDFREAFPSNDPANPRRTLDAFQGLFDDVHLFDNGLDRSLASIQSFLLAELIDRTPATGPVFVPATPGSDGFLLHYTNSGVARAEVPAEIVKAYMYGEALANAGLLQEPALESASDGRARCQELLHPLTDTIARFLDRRQFVYSDVFGDIPTLQEFHDGTVNHPTRWAQIVRFIDRYTCTEVYQQMRNAVRESYAAFRATVRQFVAEKGPLAFYNLFDGRFVCAAGELPHGIRFCLENLCNGKKLDGHPIPFLPVEHAQADLDHLYNEICGHAPGIMALLHQNYQQERHEWVQHLEMLVNAHIMEQRRAMLFGQNGILTQEFLKPADELAMQLYAFGQVLRAQGNACLLHGEALQNPRAFRGCVEYPTVNPGALNDAAFDFIRHQAQHRALQILPHSLRDALVSNFFANPGQWLYVDDSLIAPDGIVQLRLRDPRRPIAARHAFERAMRNFYQPLPRQSVEGLFREVANAGISAPQYAQQILHELLSRMPNPSPNCTYRLTYPAILTAWCYVHIENALQNAANAMLWHNVQFFTSPDDDSITLQQVSCPMDITQIVDAHSWEQAYLARLNQPGSGLHGISPDGSRTPWSAYPGISSPDNPLSHTATTRRQMDNLILEAKAKGILYAEQHHGYVIRFAHLAQAGLSWHYEPVEPPQDAFAVLQAAAAQSGHSIPHLSRTVCLSNAVPMPTEEQAWEQAHLVLYAHRPMLCAIQDTLALTAPWYQAAEAYIAEYTRRQRPRQFLRLLETGALRQEEENWILTTPDEMAIRIRCQEWEFDPDLDNARGWELHLYVLYEKLMDKYPPEEWEELAAFARKRTPEPAQASAVHAMLEAEQKILRHMRPAAIQHPHLWEKIQFFYENLR